MTGRNKSKTNRREVVNLLLTERSSPLFVDLAASVGALLELWAVDDGHAHVCPLQGSHVVRTITAHERRLARLTTTHTTDCQVIERRTM